MSIIQALNPGGAFGYAVSAQSSRFYLYGMFQLDTTAARGLYPGTPVAFGLTAAGNTARTVLPAGEAAVAGFNNTAGRVIGAALDWIQLPTAAGNPTAGAGGGADVAPSQSGPNASIGAVLVGGYLSNAPVFSDTTAGGIASTTTLTSFCAGVVPTANITVGGTLANYVINGGWCAMVVGAVTAANAYTLASAIMAPPSNLTVAAAGSRSGTATATGAGPGSFTWTSAGGINNMASTDIGSPVWLATSGAAGGSPGLTSVITGVASTTSFTTADPNLKSGAPGSVNAIVGSQCDLWFTV